MKKEILLIFYLFIFIKILISPKFKKMSQHTINNTILKIVKNHLRMLKTCWREETSCFEKNALIKGVRFSQGTKKGLFPDYFLNPRVIFLVLVVVKDIY